MKTLEDIIRTYIPLPTTPSTKGWYPVLCKVCNDHGRKGKRGGFKFEPDGTVAYHCFNCGPDMNTAYVPHKHKTLPSKMEIVLREFGVPEKEWQHIILQNYGNQGTKTTSEDTKDIIQYPQPIKLPEIFYPLSEAKPNDKWAYIAREYLRNERAVDPDSYPFFLAQKTSDPLLKKWYGRIIIPIFRDDKPVFYMGRDLTSKQIRKYESPNISRDNIIQGFDKLFSNRDFPLFITEGWFDAFSIDGIGILGNEISQMKFNIIDRSPRRKIYIPDLYGNGKQAALQAIKHGWEISIPKIGDCKDMNEAVRKYGKLYVLKSLMDNISGDYEATVKVELLCK